MIRYLGEEGIAQSEELKEHGVLINEECAREEREEAQGALHKKINTWSRDLCRDRETTQLSAAAAYRDRETGSDSATAE